MQDSNFYPYSWAPPLEKKKFQPICPWCFKAALDLERVESLKPMAKMRLEHICSKFSVLPISSSSTVQLRVGDTLFNSTVPHPHELQTMAFLTYNGPQSCSLLFSTTHDAIQKIHVFMGMKESGILWCLAPRKLDLVTDSLSDLYNDPVRYIGNLGWLLHLLDVKTEPQGD